jgi:5-methylcytosine-specific restriction endonuclease McrA
MRDMKTAFQNAISRGRVEWHLKKDRIRRDIAKEQLPRGKRMKILERDKMRCKICGHGAEQGTLLWVDHIVARVNGGTDDDSNLRTLCIDCNIGKAHLHKEIRVVGGFVSGKQGTEEPLSE